MLALLLFMIFWKVFFMNEMQVVRQPSSGILCLQIHYYVMHRSATPPLQNPLSRCSTVISTAAPCLVKAVISKAVADTLPVCFLLKMRQQATFHWRKNTVYFNLVSDVYLPLPLNPPPPIPTKEKQRRLEYEWYNIQVRWWQDVVYLNYVSLDDTSWISVKDTMPCPRDPLSEGQNVQDFSFGDTLFGDTSSWHC